MWSTGGRKKGKPAGSDDTDRSVIKSLVGKIAGLVSKISRPN